jgi:LPXTG-site transpeptidase (sortase) family protein
MNNPLFTDKKDKALEASPQNRQGPSNTSPVVATDNTQGTSTQNQDSSTIPPTVTADNPAVTYIRQKIDKLYEEEPKAQTVMGESVVVRPRSKHQQYMFDLSQSGKSIVEIQTAWHNYYHSLSNEDKHQVWHEFYEANAQLQAAHDHKLQTQPNIPAAVVPIKPAPPTTEMPRTTTLGQADRKKLGLPISSDQRTVELVKKQLIQRLSNPQKPSIRQNFSSLLFGLSMGVLVVLIVMFSFFNQIIIAPFIQPSRHITALPLIISTSAVAPSATPEVIIPKINVEIPVVYTATSDNDTVIENDLQNGVVHYPSTVLPGQDGNAAFFGHSSNNIFNPGKYKFAFVLLHELVKGDTFYLTFNGQVYVYQVISRQIVSPNDVAVLGNVAGQTATATLITCDPPGTSINRLVVVGSQISPSPSTNTASTIQTTTQPSQLAGNGPSLWSRLWNDIF